MQEIKGSCEASQGYMSGLDGALKYSAYPRGVRTSNWSFSFAVKSDHVTLYRECALTVITYTNGDH